MSEEPARTDAPTTGEEAPWRYCPDCGSPVRGKQFCPQCGRPLRKEAAPPAREPAPAAAPGELPASEAEPPPSYLDRPGLAFAAEFVPGLFGFLGLGWLYAHRTPIGIGLLLGWWGVLVVVAATVRFFFGDICCLLWLPFQVSIPLISGFVVAGELRQAQRRRLMGL